MEIEMRMFSLKNAQIKPWCIQVGTAQTWIAPSAGYLCVTRGRLWASCDAACGPALDHVLLTGDRLLLSAGQRVVLEPWAYEAQTDVALDWQMFNETAPSRF